MKTITSGSDGEYYSSIVEWWCSGSQSIISIITVSAARATRYRSCYQRRAVPLAGRLLSQLLNCDTNRCHRMVKMVQSLKMLKVNNNIVTPLREGLEDCWKMVPTIRNWNILPKVPGKF